MCDVPALDGQHMHGLRVLHPCQGPLGVRSLPRGQVARRYFATEVTTPFSNVTVYADSARSSVV